MNGLEVLREIRALSAETIVVLITGETTQDNVLKAIEGNADGVIVKPFNRARVMAEIARGLRRRESGKQAEPPTSMK
jgi:DNA-binding response OmpR family regulator